eukprot:14823658-Alexandrium_andersonii.AAC.1
MRKLPSSADGFGALPPHQRPRRLNNLNTRGRDCPQCVWMCLAACSNRALRAYCCSKAKAWFRIGF